MTIHQVLTFRDEVGHEVQKLIEHGDAFGLGKASYSTSATISVQTPAGPRPLSISVPLKGAKSIEDCFARLKELVENNHQTAAQEALRQINLEMQKQSLRNVNGV